MRNEKILLVAAAILATPVHASGCDEEIVRRVKDGGSIVVLKSGGIYEVEPGDTQDSALWSAGDGVLVCGGEEMINKDNGDKVRVTPLR